MQALYSVLTVLVALTMITGLFLSFRYRSRQKASMDKGVDPSISKNPILLNPVFWAYLVFMVLFLGWIWFNKLYYKAPF